MNKFLGWEDDFPKGYGHTSIAFLQRCIGFTEAKNGDLNAACFVVSRCIKPKRISELREQFPQAVLIPVTGQNMLPLALASEIGLPVWDKVGILHTIPRKMLCAIERLLHKPDFIGYVQEDMSYILVDDVITQGGTISALRDFVRGRGGKVVAVAALAYAIGSHAIAPMKKYIIRLLVKFGGALIKLLEQLGVAESFQELTNSQTKYLLRFSSVRNIEKRIAQCRAIHPFLSSTLPARG